MKIISLIVLTCFTLFASTQEALNAYKNHHYKKAFELYAAEAKEGDTQAQNALSYLYFNGIGTDKNIKSGLYWLQKAAEKKDTRACLDLGMMYLFGENVSRNLPQAFGYLNIAAQQGDLEAKYNVAFMYYRGEGVKQDVKKAAQLLEEAAKAGYAPARKNVAKIYMQALNLKKAKYWLQINAREGDKDAEALLKEIESLEKD
jgi:hypothetical protein